MITEKVMNTEMELRLTIKANITTSVYDLDYIIENFAKTIEKKCDIQVKDYDVIEFHQELIDEVIPGNVEEERWV